TTTRPPRSRTTSPSVMVFGRRLPRESMLFLIVAFFARGDDVAFGALAAADDRHEVVHGERSGGKFFPAIVADADRAPPLPPLACAQFARLFALAPNLLVGHRGEKRRFLFHHNRAHFLSDLKYTAKAKATTR